MTTVFTRVFIALLLICGLFRLHAQKKATVEKSPVERQGESDLLMIKTKVRFSTLIVLPEGEEISEVTCGDKDYWVIEAKDNAVFVKPAKEGAVTNVNVIAKSKTIYSFIVQEISKPGSKEKPDLRVLLAGDEVTKLRKDKANLEELLTRTEAAANELNDNADATGKKKGNDVARVEATAPKVKGPVVEELIATPAIAKGEVEKVLVVASVGEPIPDAASAAITEPEEKPIATAIVIERTQEKEKPLEEGLIRRSGRLLGRVFRKLSGALHLY